MRAVAATGLKQPLAHVLLVAFAVLAAAGRAHADMDGPGASLARMYGAVRSLDYQGAFVYLRAGQPEALQIFHAGGEPERERIVGLNGPRAEYAREGGNVVCASGASPPTLFANPTARLLPLIPDLRGGQAAKYYSIVAGPEDRVAGYVAQRIEIVPRDGYRYGYRLWLERESGFPLRSTIVDASRRTLEEYLFVTLDIGKRPGDGDLAAAASATAVDASAERSVAQAHWDVADLPPGFARVRIERTGDTVQAGEHQVYSDGVANVSVYVEPRAAGDNAERGYSRGMLNIFTRDAGSWRTTALGDVPRATLERIVRSVRPTDAALKHD